jgi:Transposase DDE domain
VYLRVTQRRNKNGDVVRYVALAHNERNERGVPVARVIHTFGREDEVDREALARLVASISRFLEPEQVLAAGAPAGFDFVSAREQGRPHVVQALWSELGIGRALGRVAGSRRYRREVEREVFAMVCQRTIAPASKLEATRWAPREVVLPGVGELSDDGLYSAMDFLLECSERVQEAVFFSVANLLNAEVDVIFFDTTSTYFEVEVDDDEAGLDDEDEDEAKPAGKAPLEQAGRRRLGHSKDHRPDLPQVIIGMAVTREGVPVRLWTFPGNTSDQVLIRTVKDDLRAWRLHRVIWVVDRGFASQANRRYLQRAGGGYIMGERLRGAPHDAAAALARQGRYHSVAGNLRVKQVRVDGGAARDRFVICHNPDAARRDADIRDQIVARLEDEIAGSDALPARQRAELAGRLKTKTAFNRFLRVTPAGKLRVDRTAVRRDAHYDGKYLLRTSDESLTPDDIAHAYKALYQAERGWRDLKTVQINLRPVFHHKDQRIQAHVQLCWLALLILRVAELAVGDTWRNIRDELDRLHLVTLATGNGHVAQRGELTPRQRVILHALDLPEPPRFYDFTPSGD